jgi:hypothetical protein
VAEDERRFVRVWVSPEAGSFENPEGWAFPACESVNFVRRRLGAAFAQPVVIREVLSGVIFDEARVRAISGKISSGFPSGIA